MWLSRPISSPNIVRDLTVFYITAFSGLELTIELDTVMESLFQMATISGYWFCAVNSGLCEVCFERNFLTLPAEAVHNISLTKMK